MVKSEFRTGKNIYIYIYIFGDNIDERHKGWRRREWEDKGKNTLQGVAVCF